MTKMTMWTNNKFYTNNKVILMLLVLASYCGDFGVVMGSFSFRPDNNDSDRQPRQEPFECNICGDGFEITNWDAIVTQESGLTCREIDNLAQSGQGSIDQQQCAELVLVAFNACGCTFIEDDGATYSPTTTPTETATWKPTFGPPPPCYSDLNEIDARERQVRDADFPIAREIILCPHTIYVMGRQDTRDEMVYYDGFAAIRPRPNSHYKCGPAGSSLNRCTIRDGDIAILSTKTPNSLDDHVTGVVFEGITFESSFRSAAVFAMRGDITFIDCIFRNQQNLGTVIVLFGSEIPTLRRLGDEDEYESLELEEAVEEEKQVALSILGGGGEGKSVMPSNPHSRNIEQQQEEGRRFLNKHDKYDEEDYKGTAYNGNKSRIRGLQQHSHEVLLPSRSRIRRQLQKDNRDPTDSPTESPTENPTESPTKTPKTKATNEPTTSPSEATTETPTLAPQTNAPTTTEPTNPSPTDVPTISPTTKGITELPTESSTESPTEVPTESPTEFPSEKPTESPTEFPSDIPTESPTESPSESPTDSPSQEPTLEPSSSPSRATNTPTIATNSPTIATDSPTVTPTIEPSAAPTIDSSTLTITFRQTVFENIQVGPRGDFVRPGIVSAESERTILIFEDVKFVNNSFAKPEVHPRSWAVKTPGPLTMRDTCFVDNEFIGLGTVLTIGDDPIFNVGNNYGTFMDDVHAFCQFLVELPNEDAVHENVTDLTNTNYDCTYFDANQCDAEDPPTERPTGMPSDSPSASPVASPTYWENVGGVPTSVPESGGTSWGARVSNYSDLILLVVFAAMSFGALIDVVRI